MSSPFPPKPASLPPDEARLHAFVDGQLPPDASGPELRDFADRPVRDGEERNWRALDPRRDEAEEDEEEG